MDAKIQEMIKKRQEANREIVKLVSDVVDKYPDLRFGQILANLSIIEYDYGADKVTPKDIFYEEPVITLNRIKNKKK